MYLNSCTELDDLSKGRYRSIHALKPVAYLRNGSWRSMTHALTATADAAMPIGVDEAMAVRFDPRIAGKSPLVRIDAPDRKNMLKLALLGANNVGALATKTNEYVYPEALTGADLVLTYGGHKFSADFRLKKGHPKQIQWRLDEQVGFDPKAMTVGNLIIRQPVLLSPEAALSEMAGRELRWDVTQSGGKYILSCVLPDGDWAGWTLDPTLTLQPDAAAGEDTFLNGGIPTLNSGATNVVNYDSRAFASGKTVPMYRFDLSGVPAGATITAGGFSFTPTGKTLTTAATYTTRRILIGNSGWIEGTQSNALALAGEPCWNAKEADGAGGVTTAWAGSVGCSTEGTDYSANELGTFDVPAGGYDLNIEVTYSMSAAEVAAMVAANYGFLSRDLTNRNTLFLTASSDHATAAYRPKLVIEYEEPSAGRYPAILPSRAIRPAGPAIRPGRR